MRRFLLGGVLDAAQLWLSPIRTVASPTYMPWMASARSVVCHGFNRVPIASPFTRLSQRARKWVAQ
jgi:hypothetical protein